MNAQFVAPENRPPLAVIHSLIDEHGAWATVRAVLTAILRGDRVRALRASIDFSDHLRRDIGLEPEPQSRKYWELRL